MDKIKQEQSEEKYSECLTEVEQSTDANNRVGKTVSKPYETHSSKHDLQNSKKLNEPFQDLIVTRKREPSNIKSNTSGKVSKEHDKKQTKRRKKDVLKITELVDKEIKHNRKAQKSVPDKGKPYKETFNNGLIVGSFVGATISTMISKLLSKAT